MYVGNRVYGAPIKQILIGVANVYTVDGVCAQHTEEEQPVDGSPANICKCEIMMDVCLLGPVLSRCMRHADQCRAA
jgi:hypothetical protein